MESNLTKLTFSKKGAFAVSLAQWSIMLVIFTSHVSGRGNRIGPVILSFCLSICLSVCVSVSALTAEPLDLRMHGTGMDLEYILDECDGQGHRSKFKVTSLKKLDFFHIIVMHCRTSS